MLKNKNTVPTRIISSSYNSDIKHITVTGFANKTFNSATAKAVVVKLKKAKVNHLATGNDLGEVMKITVEKFKADSAVKITKAELKINEFKKKIAVSTNEIAVIYQQQVDKFEATKTNLQSVLESYNEVGKSKWESFKHQFNKDLVAFNNEIVGFKENIENTKAK